MLMRDAGVHARYRRGRWEWHFGTKRSLVILPHAGGEGIGGRKEARQLVQMMLYSAKRATIGGGMSHVQRGHLYDRMDHRMSRLFVLKVSTPTIIVYGRTAQRRGK
jgi:hypothetical protein